MEFLGVEATDDPLRWRLPVSSWITGGVGQLFGGCGLAAAVAVLETVTGKPAAWATAQFVANTFPPQVIELAVTILADGRNFSQARVEGRVDGREVLAVSAALGSKRFAHGGRWLTMPDVAPPHRCPVRTPFGPDAAGVSQRMEQRVVSSDWGDDVRAPFGVVRVWVRFPDRLAGTVTGLSIGADFLPLALRAALGRDVFGASLDNTIRFVAAAPHEWVLADLHIEEVSDGVGHGSVTMWSEAGDLLARGSQTCAVRDLAP
ncbi:MAG: thioesterase family protein [Acidimicrobiia bacterium]|nr:thioesterase family protein [Acidimicrobiia bacterium]